jgi:hypothetical protein
MNRIVLIIIALVSASNGALYQAFPGFQSLYESADFVGIVTLVKRDVPKNKDDQDSEMYGPHRFFSIKSIVIFKGDEIDGAVARLADRRIEIGGVAAVPAPFEDILTPEKQFLVFLNGRTKANAKGWDQLHGGSRYQWDEVHAEGAVLPVSPLTNFLTIDIKNPYKTFDQIISDYTEYTKKLYEHAVAQQRLVKQKGQQAVPSDGHKPSSRASSPGSTAPADAH